jgi:hypothetical protein
MSVNLRLVGRLIAVKLASNRASGTPAQGSVAANMMADGAALAKAAHAQGVPPVLNPGVQSGTVPIIPPKPEIIDLGDAGLDSKAIGDLLGDGEKKLSARDVPDAVAGAKSVPVDAVADAADAITPPAVDVPTPPAAGDKAGLLSRVLTRLRGYGSAIKGHPYRAGIAGGAGVAGAAGIGGYLLSRGDRGDDVASSSSYVSPVEVSRGGGGINPYLLGGLGLGAAGLGAYGLHRYLSGRRRRRRDDED